MRRSAAKKMHDYLIVNNEIIEQEHVAMEILRVKSETRRNRLQEQQYVLIIILRINKHIRSNQNHRYSKQVTDLL